MSSSSPTSLGEELRAGVFHAGQGRDARRSEHVLAELGLFRILKHEAHAVEAHDVADLVRVGADGRRAPRQDGAGEIFRDHHRALDVHMRVDVAGDQVAAMTVVVRLGRAGRPPVLPHAPKQQIRPVCRHWPDRFLP